MEKAKTSKKKKVVLITLGVGTAGLLGYFGWQQFLKMKNKNNEESSETLLPPPPANFSSGYKPTIAANDEFPLKKGSKGSRVKQFQEALIAKHGKSILPRYGADGDFGSETVNALKTAGLPASIDESTFNVLVKARSFDALSLAKNLFSAAFRKDFNSTISNLKQLRTTDDYSAVSKHFLNYRLGAVRQTLVNGLLNTFTSESQKQQIRLEFSRIGLKYDGNKWSLSGFYSPQLITNKPTIIWKDRTTAIKVPANMVLGSEVASRNGYTVFENNNQKFIVETKTIKRL